MTDYRIASFLGFLDDGSQKGPPSPSPLVSPAVRSELSFSRSTSLPSGPEGASSSASRRVKQEEPESSTGGAKSFQNALKRKIEKFFFTFYVPIITFSNEY